MRKMKIQKRNVTNHSVEAYAVCACNVAMCSCPSPTCFCACQDYNPANSDANTAYVNVGNGSRSSSTYSMGNSSVS